MKDGNAFSFLNNQFISSNNTTSYENYYRFTVPKNRNLERFSFKEILNIPSIYLFDFDNTERSSIIDEDISSTNLLVKSYAIAAIKKILKNNFNQSVDENSLSPQDIAKISHILCREHAYSTRFNLFSADDSTVSRVGYSSAGKRNNKNFWDAAIGTPGLDITDIPSNSNSLVGLAQSIETVDGKSYKVLTFEDKYLVDDVGTVNSAKLLTPGSNFYIEGTLNNSADAFDTTRIDTILNKLDDNITFLEKVMSMFANSDPNANFANTIGISNAGSKRVEKLFNDSNFLGKNNIPVDWNVLTELRNPISFLRIAENEILSNSSLLARDVVNAEAINIGQERILNNRLHSPHPLEYNHAPSKDVSWLLLSLASKNENIKSLLFMRTIALMNKIKNDSSFNDEAINSNNLIEFDAISNSLIDEIKKMDDTGFNPYEQVVDQIATGLQQSLKVQREFAVQELESRKKNYPAGFDLFYADDEEEKYFSIIIGATNIDYGPGYWKLKVRVVDRDNDYPELFSEAEYGKRIYARFIEYEKFKKLPSYSTLDGVKYGCKRVEQDVYYSEREKYSDIYEVTLPASINLPKKGQVYNYEPVYVNALKKDLGIAILDRDQFKSSGLTNPLMQMLNNIAIFMAKLEAINWFIPSSTGPKTPYSGVSKMTFYAEVFNLCYALIKNASPEEVVDVIVSFSFGDSPTKPLQLVTKLKNENYIVVSSTINGKTVYTYDTFLAKSEFTLWQYNRNLRKVVHTMNEALLFLKNQFTQLKNTLTSERYTSFLKKVNDILQSPRMTRSLLNKNQLFLIGSKLNDLSARSDSSYSSPIKNIVPYFLELKDNPDMDLLLPFEDIHLASWNLWLKKFFKNNIFSNKQGFNKKILSVGIPQKLQRYLQTNVSETYGSSKKNNLINLKIYRVDYLKPDIVHKPLKFIFDLSSYPKRILEPYVSSQKIQDKETRDFFNLEQPTGQNFYPSQDSPVSAFDQFKFQTSKEGYQFLFNDINSLNSLIQNHMISLLLEEYLYFRSGVKLDEHVYYRYNSINNFAETVNGQIPVQQQQLQQPVISGHSRVH